MAANRDRSGNPAPNRGGGLKTTTGQRRVKVSDKDAAKIARESKKAYRARAIAKRVGTLSANEQRQITKIDTVIRPKPLTKKELEARARARANKPELRKSLTKTVNPARPKREQPKPRTFNPDSPERAKALALKRLNKKMDKLQPRPTGPNVRPFTKAQAAHRAELLRNAKARLERAKAESKTRLTAEERLKLKNAASNFDRSGGVPPNSMAPAPRKNSAEMLADRDRALKAAGKVKTLRADGKVRAKRVRSPESVQRNIERKTDRQQGRDARRNNKRYEHPANERGVSMKIRMKDVLDKADAAIKEASARKAKEREKVAKTPAAKAKVDATLAAKRRADKAEATRRARNTLRNRSGRPTLRGGGAIGGGGALNDLNK